MTEATEEVEEVREDVLDYLGWIFIVMNTVLFAEHSELLPNLLRCLFVHGHVIVLTGGQEKSPPLV